MNLLVALAVVTVATIAPAADTPSQNPPAARELTDLQRDFMTWQFGMFIHFNLGTAADIDWAGGYEDPALFNPTKLDCGQWVDEAKAVGMTYMVLTVKHTEGIALHDSSLTTHDITKFTNFRGDIVREFVDACRSRGLKVGLYYCFPGDYSDDAHHNASPPGQPNLYGLPPEAAGDYVGFVKRQLAEMLTRYGPVDLLWIDQHANKYTGAQWPEMLAYLRLIAPHCTIVANNAATLDESDAVGIEFPWRKQAPPEGNALPAEVCDTIQTNQRWFWRPVTQPADLQTVDEIFARLQLCNDRHANYLLNVPPDPEGRISGAHLELLRAVGARVKSDPH